jgi:hypothetical protein
MTAATLQAILKPSLPGKTRTGFPARTSEERETAMAAEFLLGTRASCSDGVCGEVRRTILDPVALTVTHLVVQPRHRGALGRLVPVALADATPGEVKLRCTLAEFERLDPAEETDIVEGAGYGGGYGSAASVQATGTSAAWGSAARYRAWGSAWA